MCNIFQIYVYEIKSLQFSVIQKMNKIHHSWTFGYNTENSKFVENFKW